MLARLIRSSTTGAMSNRRQPGSVMRMLLIRCWIQAETEPRKEWFRERASASRVTEDRKQVPDAECAAIEVTVRTKLEVGGEPGAYRRDIDCRNQVERQRQNIQRLTVAHTGHGITAGGSIEVRGMVVGCRTRCRGGVLLGGWVVELPQHG